MSDDKSQHAPILDYHEIDHANPPAGMFGWFLLVYLLSATFVGVPGGMVLLRWKLGYMYLGEELIPLFAWLLVTACVLACRAIAQTARPPLRDVALAAIVGALSWVPVVLVFYLLVIASGQYRVRSWP